MSCSSQWRTRSRLPDLSRTLSTDAAAGEAGEDVEDVEDAAGDVEDVDVEDDDVVVGCVVDVGVLEQDKSDNNSTVTTD